MRRIFNWFLVTFLAILLVISFRDTAASAISPTYTLSGIVVAQDNTPLANINILAQRISLGGVSSNGCTDDNGHYSITVTPGVYRLNPQGSTEGPSYPCEGTYSPLPGSQAPTDGIIFSGLSKLYQEVTVTSSDIVKDFIIPTAKVTLRALDINGVPFINRYAYLSAGNVYESALIEGGSNTISIGSTFLYPRQTDSNGEVSGYVVKGATYEPGTICVNPFPYPVVCNISKVTISEDTIYTLSPRPQSPKNLKIASPTREPVLVWDMVPGTQSYNVYRQGVQVGSTESQSFTDASAPEMLNTYTVTAVNGSESDHSANVSVVVDRTAPEITHTTSKAVNEHGWYNGDFSITFACSDASSGIESCSNPLDVNAEGKDMQIVGMAIDKLGNSKSLNLLINMDKTTQSVSKPSMSKSSVKGSDSVSLNVLGADNLSGILRGEFFVDKDPGVGKGSAMTYSNGKLTATTTFNGLFNGQHKVFMRTLDKAGNWSQTVSVGFTYTSGSTVTIIQELIQIISRIILNWLFKL